jgi:hypothetical protein
MLHTGKTFANGEQLTADKLNQVIDQATFNAAEAVDGSTITLISGAMAVNDDGITEAKIENGAVTKAKIENGAVTPDKLSTGGPSWNTDGETTFSYNGSTTSGIYTTQGGTKTIYVGNFDSDAQLWVKSDTSGYGQLVFGDSNDDDVCSIRYDHSDNSLRFIANAAERISISDDGQTRVGGVASTATKMKIYNYATNYGYAIDFYGKSGSTDYRPLNFRNGSASIVGSVAHTNTSTSYNTSSDYRLKEDIIEIDGSIDRLKALKPCNFKWKSDGTRADGFIAHEAQEVVPEAVTGTKDAVDEEGNPDYQGIDQAKLVPLLTKALQEAVAKIESLEARVAALEL